MAFIKTIAAADANGEVRSMYERQQASWGYVPNYAKVFCHRPEVLARWGRLLAEIRRPMDDRRFELVTFAAAHELRHTACALVHGKALGKFVGDDAVRAIADGDDSEQLTDAEKAMVRFARKVSQDASTITSGDVEGLRAHGLEDEEIFDIAAAVAGRAFFTKLLDSLGVEGDSGLLKFESAFREALTVGRPVDFHAPEMLPT